MNKLSTQMGADVFKKEFDQIKGQAIGFFSAAILYMVYTLAIIGTD